MSVSVVYNGVTYTIPTFREQGWATQVTSWIQAVSSGSLQTTGGTFTLTGELDFGATYGLKLAYIKTQTANVATAGFGRLARTDVISWRNQANGANLDLAVNSSNQLTFNGGTLVGGGSTLGVSDGGTNITSYTAGDMIYATGATTLVKLAIGTTGLPLTSTGTAPQWAALGATGGGTGFTTYTTGDTVYASAANTLSKLAANTDAVPKSLTQTSSVPEYLITDSGASVWNVGIAASVATNALTVALKGKDGNNASATNKAYIAFRSSTATTGTPTLRSVTGALSVVVSSGSTLGHQNGVTEYIYVYALDNAGTVELAVSTSPWDEGTLVTTVAEGGAGAADSVDVMYSTTARSGVACRLIGRIRSTQATAGTWASAPLEVTADAFRRARQVVAGANVTSNSTTTSVSYVNLTAPISVTFIAQRTGTYRVSANGAISNSVVGNSTYMSIVNTSGSAVVIRTNDTFGTAAGIGYGIPATAYGLFLLTAGTSYTFNIQMKVNAGTGTFAAGNNPSGTSLIAEEL